MENSNNKSGKEINPISEERFSRREDVEWSNTWYAKAQNPDARRILFIGDSVLRNIFGRIQRCVPEIAVDFFGTSAVCSDKLFYKQLENFWEYKYDIIILGMSSHRILTEKVSESEEEKLKFKNNLSALINYLKEKTKNIIIAAGTPFVLINKKIIPEFDKENNAEIQIRNNIAEKLAEENALPFFDYYNLSLSMPKLYKYSDRIHFDRISDNYTALEIIKTILKLNLDTELLNTFLKGKTAIEKTILESKKLNRQAKFFSIKQIEESIRIKILGLIEISFKAR